MTLYNKWNAHNINFRNIHYIILSPKTSVWLFVKKFLKEWIPGYRSCLLRLSQFKRFVLLNKKKKGCLNKKQNLDLPCHSSLLNAFELRWNEERQGTDP